MKKQLLLGTVLFATISAFSQNNGAKSKPIISPVNLAERLATKYQFNESTNNVAAKAPLNQNSDINTPAVSPQEASSAIATPTVQWKAIGGSMNIYGYLVSSSKPLQYNDELNAVSFVHRAGSTYTSQILPAGTGNTGSMVMHLTSNWGSTWDSTCIFSNATNWARYPQGGIYNPMGGTNLSNAYGVGMGPVTDPAPGVGWKGSWYASKQLGAGNYNSTSSQAAGAQQFMANTPPFNVGLSKHDFSRYSFSSTDDAKVRSIASIYKDANGTTLLTQDFRGAMVVKGNFNAGTFTWVGDSIIPATITHTTGYKQVYSQPLMAWNEAGDVGYVVFIGAAATATGSNKGYQPIVYKTTNSGTSWAPINGIDFNKPAMQPVKDHIRSITTSTLEIPYFSLGEGVDCTVDGDGNLHIVSLIQGTYSNHNDSLGYSHSIGTFSYTWGHVKADRPYVYDFVGNGTGDWTYTLIDSLSTEGPGGRPTDPGFGENPWDINPADGNKLAYDSRLQVGRTPDGRYIIYSWAESDTAFTNQASKFSSLPNVKVRCAAVTGGTNTVSPTEINLTRPTPAPVVPTYTTNTGVSNRAMFHYQSNKALFVNCVTGTVTLRVPFTISNSFPYAQLTENKIWYSSTVLDFAGLSTYCTGFNQSLAYNVNGIEIYPNPANSNATIAVDLKEEGSVNVNIYNTIGSLVKSISAKGTIGENKMNVDLNNLSSGIYMVKISVGNTTSTKKLIVE